MKMIFKIARMELQKMFYSPIAWFVLIIFGIQAGITFMGSINNFFLVTSLGYNPPSLSTRMYTSPGGVLYNMQNYLYLFIPLLTMGLLSREFSSGSIKLLYSSPISNKQIVWGKFVSMMVFGLAMAFIMFIIAIFGVFAIKDFDFPLVLTAILGLYLVICAYSSIGLFMSSLTSYQIVAAIGTFAALFVLGQVGRMWQDVEFVRDITYWLSINGRSGTLLRGLICSEDILYFILVSGLFITFTIFRLKGIREKRPRYISFMRCASVFMVVAMIGYVSTIPSLMKYHDSTHNNTNTLTPNSQDVIAKLKGKINITTYVNIFDDNYYSGSPSNQKYDMSRYEHYTRFYPYMKINYKYYYDLPVDEKALKSHNKRYEGQTQKQALEKACDSYNVNLKRFKQGKDYLGEIDLESELNRFVCKVATEDGKSTYLRIFDDGRRYPDESQITAAFKRLVMELPLVGFVTGHEERDVDDLGSRGYFRLTKEKPFRWSLINNGFDFTTCELSKLVDKNIDVLIIADAKTIFLEQEIKNLNDYIDRGGNLIIACDLKRQKIMNPLVERFGIKFLTGQVVEYNKGYTMDLVTSVSTKQGQKLAYQFENIQGEQAVMMPGVVGISYKEGNEFKYVPVLVSDTIRNMPNITDEKELKKLKETYTAKQEDKDAYKGSWNELKTQDFIDEIATFNPEEGETGGAITTALALTRKVGDKEQRIMILGDADCLSNGELSRKRTGFWALNFNMGTGMFYWLSGNEVPIDIRRPTPTDNELYIEKGDKLLLNALYKIIIPALLGLAFLLIWLRRRGR